MQRGFHLQQFLALAFEHLGYRNAGPARYHVGDFLFRHLVLQQHEAFGFDVLRGLELLLQFRQRSVLDFAHPRVILRALCSLKFKPGLFDLFLDPSRSLQCRLLRFPDFFQIVELAFENFDFGFEIL